MKKILKEHDISPKKYLGQNFLINKRILKKIIETANLENSDTIVEIGPGLGILTEALTQIAKKVVSIEVDQNLIQVLKEKFKNTPNIQIIEQDALQFEPPKNQYKIVANIPYYITSPLINHFLQSIQRPESMTLLVQHEVAEKICTLNPDMSILSLQVALFGKAKYIQKVKAGNFFPPPKVDSAIIHISIYNQNDPNYIDLTTAQKILKLAKIAFSQGRKKLSNTLSKKKEELEKLRLNDKRPQHLSMEEWKKLVL